MDFSPGSQARMLVALSVLGVLALLVYLTMEPGRYEQFVWIVLAFFAVRVVLGRMRSR